MNIFQIFNNNDNELSSFKKYLLKNEYNDEYDYINSITFNKQINKIIVILGDIRDSYEENIEIPSFIKIYEKFKLSSNNMVNHAGGKPIKYIKQVNKHSSGRCLYSKGKKMYVLYNKEYITVKQFEKLKKK